MLKVYLYCLFIYIYILIKILSVCILLSTKLYFFKIFVFNSVRISIVYMRKDGYSDCRLIWSGGMKRMRMIWCFNRFVRCLFFFYMN